MLVPAHRWSLSLALTPGRSDAQFLHWSKGLGTQCLDSTAIVLGPDIKTERQYLSELYSACLLFMERRA